jgi:hypothetical protein
LFIVIQGIPFPIRPTSFRRRSVFHPVLPSRVLCEATAYAGTVHHRLDFAGLGVRHMLHLHVRFGAHVAAGGRNRRGLQEGLHECVPIRGVHDYARGSGCVEFCKSLREPCVVDGDRYGKPCERFRADNNGLLRLHLRLLMACYLPVQGHLRQMFQFVGKIMLLQQRTCVVFSVVETLLWRRLLFVPLAVRLLLHARCSAHSVVSEILVSPR